MEQGQQEKRKQGRPRKSILEKLISSEVTEEDKKETGTVCTVQYSRALVFSFSSYNLAAILQPISIFLPPLFLCLNAASDNTVYNTIISHQSFTLYRTDRQNLLCSQCKFTYNYSCLLPGLNSNLMIRELLFQHCVCGTSYKLKSIRVHLVPGSKCTLYLLFTDKT